MTLHPNFKGMFDALLGVNMTEYHEHCEDPHEGRDEEDEDCEDTFSTQRKEHGVKVL